MATIERFWFLRDVADSSNATIQKLAIVEKGSDTAVNGVQSGYVDPTVTISGGIHVYGSFTTGHYNAWAINSSVPIEGGPKFREQFHSFILSKVIAEGYKDPRNMDLNTAQYYDAQARSVYVRARKNARSNSAEFSHIKPVDF